MCDFEICSACAGLPQRLGYCEVVDGVAAHLQPVFCIVKTITKCRAKLVNGACVFIGRAGVAEVNFEWLCVREPGDFWGNGTDIAGVALAGIVMNLVCIELESPASGLHG